MLALAMLMTGGALSTHARNDPAGASCDSGMPAAHRARVDSMAALAEAHRAASRPGLVLLSAEHARGSHAGATPGRDELRIEMLGPYVTIKRAIAAMLDGRMNLSLRHMALRREGDQVRASLAMSLWHCRT